MLLHAVDSQLNAKIADLELGGDEMEADHTNTTSPRSSSIGSGISALSGEGVGASSSRALRNRRGGKTDAVLCIWQAPEVVCCDVKVMSACPTDG